MNLKVVILGYTVPDNLKVVILGFSVSEKPEGGYPRIYIV